MQPASSAAKSSPAPTFKDASARALSRAEFHLVGDAYLPFANAPTLNESPASFPHAIARANTDAPTSGPYRPAPNSFTPTRSKNNINAHAHASFSPAPVRALTSTSLSEKDNYGAQEASNHTNNVMTYGLAALAIGGLTVGCASALGAGLVPLAVVASVLILATVGVVAVSAIPSSNPIRTNSGSSQKLDTTSSRGVSC